MKIQLGQPIVMNRTKKYLLPCLKAYGKEFEDYFNSISKVAVGIGDMLLIESGIRYEKHIFILVNTAKNKGFTRKFLSWVRDQDMYEDEYAYDSIHQGNLLMVVIKLPLECYKAAELFKHSQFSKMFTLQDIENYFKEHPETKKVLVKDQDYRVEYAGQLSNEWGTDIDPKELEGELDLPIRKEDETFNSTKT